MGQGAGIKFRWAFAVAALTLSACRDARVVNVGARAVLDTNGLDFGDVPVGERKDLTVGIRNVGYVAFNAVEALGLDRNPSFEVDFGSSAKVMPGDTKTVIVHFHPLTEGQLSEHLSVKTDAEDTPEGAVPLTGHGTPTPIEVSPAALDFETLEVASDRTLTVKVTNPVDLPLTLTLSGTDKDQFSSDTVTIPANGSVTVNAKYFPQLTGDNAASIDVRSCDGCTPTRVALKGKSVPSALVFDPAPVPFADVPVHESTVSTSKVTNITWRPVQVRQVGTSDYSFSVLTDLSNHTFNPNDSMSVQLQFAARSSGPSTGTMKVDYQSDKARNTQVMLDARGGRPTLALAPVSIDFGSLPVGGKLEKTVRLTNAGTNGNLTFQGVGASGDSAQFNVEPPQRGKTVYPWDAGSAWPNMTASIPIAPGTDYLDVKVAFEPTQAGSFKGTVSFKSDDLFNPSRDVVVTGTAYPVGTCQYRMLPVKVDFGNVPPGMEQVLGFRFENAGTEICAVKDIHITNDGGGHFWMPGGSLAGGVVLKDDAFAAMIAFKSDAPGTFDGELQLTVSDPANPIVHLPLHAISAASCITSAPLYVNFGAVRYDCAPTPRHAFVSNQCAAPIEISNAWIGACTGTDYSIAAQPTFPMTLAPGQGYDVTFDFARKTLGQQYCPYFVSSPTEPAPYLIPIWGETNHAGYETDTFVQGQDGQLDVLFVVSNTTTMQQYQDRLKSEIPGFISKAQTTGVDLHVGVTTTGLVTAGNGLCPGGANGGEAGRLFPVDSSSTRIVVGSQAGAAASVQRDLTVGTCHNLVQGLETMRQALSSPLVDHSDDPRTPQPADGNLGFLRPSARLAVVFLSDEDDHSGFDVTAYTQFLQQLKGPNLSQRTQAFAIVPTDNSCTTAGAPGPRFTQVAADTGGSSMSICSNDYSPLLNPIAGWAAVAQKTFKLSHMPTNVAGITVTVDGATIDPSKWWVDTATGTLHFVDSAVPRAGQTIVVSYESVCGG